MLVDGEFDDKRRIVHLYNLKAVIKRICSAFEDKILIADYPESVQRITTEGSHYKIEINGKLYIIPKTDIFKFFNKRLFISTLYPFLFSILSPEITSPSKFLPVIYL